MLVGPARRTSIAGRQQTRFLSNTQGRMQDFSQGWASSATLKHLLGDDSPWVQDNSIFSFIRDIDFPVIYPFS